MTTTNVSDQDLLADLRKWTENETASLSAMMPAVYEELRRLAAGYLQGERSEHTLQPTALVHEAYLRMNDQRQSDWQNRAHFLGIAARMMRRILTNHAVARRRSKRGGPDAIRLTLDDALDQYEQKDIAFVELEAALKELELVDAQQARIVEFRFFGGLTVEETGEALGISARTVKREWSTAKRWLQRELSACA
jgi:RNA polymerase sigma-70 factor (ECF subfamily)